MQADTRSKSKGKKTRMMRCLSDKYIAKNIRLHAPDDSEPDHEETKKSPMPKYDKPDQSHTIDQ